MHSRRLAALAALSISVSSLAVLPAAEADSGTTLYVNNATAADCSDTTTDSSTTPYCTIQAAANVVAAGQAIVVATGVYAPFTISASGTATNPITVKAADPPATYATTGPVSLITVESTSATAAPIAVSGASYVDVSGFSAFSAFSTTSTESQVSVTDSSHVSVNGVYARRGSSLDTGPAVEIDGDSSAVTVSRSWIASSSSVGVQVDSGSSGDVVTTNIFVSPLNSAVVVNDAADTDVTSNTIDDACGHAVVLTGSSAESSIQNNVVEQLFDSTTNGCSVAPAASSGFEVDSAATTGTTLDYNVIDPKAADNAYDWAGTEYTSANSLYPQTGQGQHELNSVPLVSPLGPSTDTSPAVDSANSSAPGELATDYFGQARVDDPNTANTGAGTAAYYDRGAAERQGSIGTANVQTSVAGVTGLVGQAPIGTPVVFTATATDSWSGSVYYTFEFGDGTNVTSQSGVISHTFTTAGDYAVRVYTRHSQFGQLMTNGVQLGMDIVSPTSLTPQATAAPDGALGVDLDTLGSTSSWAITSQTVDYGDGQAVDTSGQLVQTTHQYTKPGTYPITVTETDQDGRTAKTTTSFTTAGSDYTSAGPTRILDTRTGTGANGVIAPVAPNGTLVLKVAGTGPIPATGVTAVVLNLTVTDATGSGFISAFPDGTAVPNVSNLNYGKGQTVANSVIVPVGADGSIDLANDGATVGSTDLIADVTGYFSAAGTAGYDTLVLPARILDTRDGTGAAKAQVKPGQPLVLTIAGADQGDIQAAGLTAVALNITVTDTSGSGFVEAYPDRVNVPNTSNINYTKGQTVANTVIVPVGADGKIDLDNSGATAGPVDLIADVTGYYSTSGPAAYVPVTPTRLLDTRQTQALGSQGVATISPETEGPSSAGASPTGYVVNLTVTEPTGTGFITAYPTAGPVPDTSNIDYTPGQTVADLAQVSPFIGEGGEVSFANQGALAGSVQLIVDIFGYYSTT